MKKVILFPALALVALISWSFNPQAKTTAVGYLMVVGSGRPGASNKAEITVIPPTGQRQVQVLRDIAVSSEGPNAEGAVALHQAELAAVNKLYRQGWRLVSVAQSTVGAGAATETVYMLEKR